MELDKTVPTLTAPGAVYRIEIPEKSRLPEICRFMRENFHREETMMRSLRGNAVITDEESKLIHEDEDDTVTSTFETSPCLVAVHNASDKIVGINLMILSKRPKENVAGSADPFDTIPVRSKLTVEYFRYLSEIYEQVDIFNKYPKVEATLEFFCIAVDKEHRRKGLAMDLSSEGIALGRKLGKVGIVFGIYTSLYSKRVAEMTGMRSILDIDLLKYKNLQGEFIFRDTKPHNIVSVMVLEL